MHSTLIGTTQILTRLKRWLEDNMGHKTLASDFINAVDPNGIQKQVYTCVVHCV